MTNASKPLVKTTGHALIIAPYIVKQMHPAKLNQRNLVTLVIIRETTKKTEAR
ncbi:hypothetical protein N483_12410 [Pseudoalteromonas luteoviolacea NCIMB 1944]|nr:hypothetical protein N483_12410 [Pseudoalteromonas luteoviolacea NCIMB 1944]